MTISDPPHEFFGADLTPSIPELSVAVDQAEALIYQPAHPRWSSDGARLRVLARLVSAASATILEQVQYDRDTGRSWAQIGDDLGISRQAAYQRYAHLTETHVGSE